MRGATIETECKQICVNALVLVLVWTWSSNVKSLIEATEDHGNE